jgi:phage baseplate assembly protein gpV
MGKRSQKEARKMQEMTAEVRAELEAIKSAARTTAEFRDWSIVEYVRSGGAWYVQMVTEDGPKTFSYDAITEYAAMIRRGEVSDVEREDATAPVRTEPETVSTQEGSVHQPE